MTPNNQSISCIVLAGGKGRRVNHADKGLLPFNSQPLITHVINILQPQVDDIIISANRNIDQYKKLSPTVKTDNNGQHGPLSGIAASLPACQHEQVLIVPCDMPYLPNDIVTKLRTNLDLHGMSIVEIENRLQLVMMINKSQLISIQNQITLGQYKLMHWVKSCSPTIIDLTDMSYAFRNINDSNQLDPV